jgi:asparagine N-glycosylation enzyme membrane subunit Stt3
VLAIALLLPLPGRTSARIRAAVARGRAVARPGWRGTVVAWSLPAASLLLIMQGVWQAVSTVGGLVRSAAVPGIGAALDTAGRAILAAIEVPLELLVFPLVGVFVLSGFWFARRLAVVLELLVIFGSLVGRFQSTRAQVSSAIAVLVLGLLLLHERATPSRR